MPRILRAPSAAARIVAATLALATAAFLATAPAAAAQTASSSGSSTSAPTAAKAWVLVDAGSGKVLSSLNDHEPRFVASLAKVMTAYVALQHLHLADTVEVSTRAAAQPAMRIGMETGQTWTVDHAVHALLMVSANDAAYALAEAAGGSLGGFARLMQQTAQRLGMHDSRWLDPAGLDGQDGFQGGTQASAYDLAIAARNALTVPTIASVAPMQKYAFLGGDGKHHTLTNHNKMLTRYSGLTGLKTGYTKAAGHTLIATARRNGRTLIAVVLDAPDAYGTAAALLDQGFATSPRSAGTGETLPAVGTHSAPSGAKGSSVAAAAHDTRTVSASGGGGGLLGKTFLFLFVLLMVAFFVRREQIKRRKRRRRAMRRAYLTAKRRGMIDVIDAERYYGFRDARLDEREGHVSLRPVADERRRRSNGNGEHRERGRHAETHTTSAYQRSSSGF